MKKDPAPVTNDFIFGPHFAQNQHTSKTGTGFYTTWTSGPRKIWDHFRVNDGSEFFNQVTLRDPKDSNSKYFFGPMVSLGLVLVMHLILKR